MYDNAMLKMGLPFVTPFIDDRLSTFSAAKARFRILDLLKVSFLYRLIMVNTHQTTHLREYVLYVLYVLLFQTSSANLSTAYKGPRVRFRKGISGRDVFFFSHAVWGLGLFFFCKAPSLRKFHNKCAVIKTLVFCWYVGIAPSTYIGLGL